MDLYNTIITDIARIVKKSINEAFDFSEIETNNTSKNISKQLREILEKDTSEKVRNIIIQACKDCGANDYAIKSWLDDIDRYCKEDSSVIINGKEYPSILYRHPVLVGPIWQIPGNWKLVETEKFRKVRRNTEVKIYYKDLPKPVLKLYNDIMNEGNLKHIHVLADDFSMLGAIDTSKINNGAIYDIFLTGIKKYMPDGTEIKKR